MRPASGLLLRHLNHALALSDWEGAGRIAETLHEKDREKAIESTFQILLNQSRTGYARILLSELESMPELSETTRLRLQQLLGKPESASVPPASDEGSADVHTLIGAWNAMGDKCPAWIIGFTWIIQDFMTVNEATEEISLLKGREQEIALHTLGIVEAFRTSLASGADTARAYVESAADDPLLPAFVLHSMRKAVGIDSAGPRRGGRKDGWKKEFDEALRTGSLFVNDADSAAPPPPDPAPGESQKKDEDDATDFAFADKIDAFMRLIDALRGNSGEAEVDDANLADEVREEPAHIPAAAKQPVWGPVFETAPPDVIDWSKPKAALQMLAGHMRREFRECVLLFGRNVNAVVTKEALTEATGYSGDNASQRTLVGKVRTALVECGFPGSIDSITERGYQCTLPLPIDRNLWENSSWKEKAIATLLIRTRGKIVTFADCWQELYGDNPAQAGEDGARAFSREIRRLRKAMPITPVQGVGFLHDPLPLLPHEVQKELRQDEHSVLKVLTQNPEITMHHANLRMAMNEARQRAGKEPRDVRLLQAMHAIRLLLRKHASSIGSTKESVPEIPWHIVRTREGFVLTQTPRADEVPYGQRFSIA